MFNDFEILDQNVQGNSPRTILDAHQNVQLSDDLVSDVFNSDHLLYVFHSLAYVNLGIFRVLEKFTDFLRFQIIACDLISENPYKLGGRSQ
jgi:hypothetical protein